MTVWIRIAMYLLAGWLSSSGYINEEVRRLLTEDPQVAYSIQLGISFLVSAVPVVWWKLAQRFGWPT